MTESARIVQVRVKPGSSKGPLVQADPATTNSANTDAANVDSANVDSVTVYLQQRPVDGAANDALVRVLATYFGVPRSAVGILRGHHSRIKQVRVERS